MWLWAPLPMPSRAYVEQRSTLDILSSFSILFQIFYIFMYMCMSDGVCTCECTCLQRTEEGAGSLETGVISSFELPSMGAGSQTQFLWKNKSSYSLRHCSGFFHLKFWDRVSHWTWRCHFSSKHPGSVCLCPANAGATDASHHLGFMGAGYELRSSCLCSKHLSHGAISLASHVNLLVFNLKLDRVPRAKKCCILSLNWDSF